MSAGDNKEAAGPRACFLPFNMKIDEIGQIYRNVLREKGGGLLRFRNIYQFSQIDELMEELRIQGYADFQSIKFALLETNGQLSVLPYAADKPATAAQVGAAVQETGLPVVIISDGRLLEHNLKGAGYEHNWLEKQLAVHGLHSPRQAFLLTVDEGGNTYCVPKKEAGK